MDFGEQMMDKKYFIDQLKELSEHLGMGLSEEMSNSYKVYDHEGHFIGLYGKSEQDGIYKPEKLFFDI